jgi:hypothetical protein
LQSLICFETYSLQEGKKKTMNTINGPGSLSNVIAAVCSIFVPGLGQLVQGRIFKAAFLFVMAAVLWFFMLGWLVHIWAILDAAVWQPRVVVKSAPKKHRSSSSAELYHAIQMPAEQISL